MSTDTTPWEVLAEYPSSSSDKTYEIRRGGDGRIYCTCPGWRFSGYTAGGDDEIKKCRHLREYIKERAGHYD